ncbi:MAG: lipoyl(octanoyl) transferase LipB [Deltaproteobacteria bacterium]|nr:lipoyl(octanoyl) transferase LipB [Deltaproteobacteria bacterium]MBW1870441.1 lipoyl(octanoyl) transferase LipB [Deltaproteobacteria bacterium]
MPRLNWTFLGEIPYLQALQLQYRLASKVARGADPVLLLLEHPPSITLGRQADPGNLNLSETEYKKRGIGVFNVLRGGDVSLHCRGQLVGYPIANLRELKYPVPAWVRGQARVIERFLYKHEIAAVWSDVHPGVWIDDKKIAALGFHISRGISTHGFALNINPDLSLFNTIIPCGLRHRQVTSMYEHTKKLPEMAQAAREIASLTVETFGLAGECFICAEDIFEEAADDTVISAIS